MKALQVFTLLLGTLVSVACAASTKSKAASSPELLIRRPLERR